MGDKLEIVFKNSCPFSNTVHVLGLPYDKKAEGAPHVDGSTVIKANIKRAGSSQKIPLILRSRTSCTRSTGFVYGNGPMPTMRQGDEVRW